jgi:hypothetical protein
MKNLTIKRILLTLAMSALIVVIACRSEEHKALGFPVEIIAEARERMSDHDLKHMDLLISRQDYSEANLDKLFRYYSEKLADERSMAIRVYTDRQRYEENQRQKELPQVFSCGPDVGADGLHDALFYRVDDKEWYFYSLNLEESLNYHLNLSDGSEAKQIVLKGNL